MAHSPSVVLPVTGVVRYRDRTPCPLLLPSRAANPLWLAQPASPVAAETHPGLLGPVEAVHRPGHPLAAWTRLSRSRPVPPLRRVRDLQAGQPRRDPASDPPRMPDPQKFVPGRPPLPRSSRGLHIVSRRDDIHRAGDKRRKCAISGMSFDVYGLRDSPSGWLYASSVCVSGVEWYS